MRLACKRKESREKHCCLFREIFRWVMFPAGAALVLVGSPAMGSIVPHGGGFLMSLDDCNDLPCLPITSLQENNFVTIAAANTGR